MSYLLHNRVEPPLTKDSKGIARAPVRLAKLSVDKVLPAPCSTSVLYPETGGNLHCFTAITSCAVLDILTPPYEEYSGRKCTYYRDYPYSGFGSGDELIDGKEDEYAWLEEIDAPDVAITTSDIVSKSVAVEFEVGGSGIRIGGMAKGSGMIHPNMGTLLGVIMTDARVDTDI
ncbi:hypothetical protein Lser_V15G03330 [Lactuca serriola]